ncbi:hypothetical protein VKT23_003761 [Stygiomarasmius scandens]|uniref:Uncharacterized protein n=1 Tax=Marasmiellus scandens TaxID=2682957 RepID=A0ABR1K4L7_9AGAR
MSMLEVVPRMNGNDMEHRKDALPLLYMWIYFNLIANTILLPILVATFIFSKRAKRHPTLINVCMTWILSGFYSLMLFYAGVPKLSDPEPSRALCIAQASAMHGILPMWSVAILVLMYHLVAVTSGNTRSEVGRVKMIFMLGSPYIVAFAFSLAALVIALRLPPDEHGHARVSRFRGVFFCGLGHKPLFDAMSIFTFVMWLGINALEVQLAMILYRNWRGLRQAGHRFNFELQLLLRVVVFGLYIFFGMVVNIISMFNHHNLVPYIYMATVGTVVFLVFGTQADVLRVWCFWRKDLPSPSPASAQEREDRLRPLFDTNNHQNVSRSTLGPNSSSASVTIPPTVHGYEKRRGPRHTNGYQRV